LLDYPAFIGLLAGNACSSERLLLDRALLPTARKVAHGWIPVGVTPGRR